MPTFQISDAATRVDLAPPGPDGVIPPAKVTFTVRNMGPRAQTGRIKVEPQNGADPAWFEISGAPATSAAELEKEFDYAGNEAIDVTVKLPAGAKAGKYGFQLRVTAEQDPDTDYVLGTAVAFDVSAAPVAVKPPTKFPWAIVAVAAVVLLAIVGGGVTWLLMRDKGTAIVMPELAKDPAEVAAFKVASLQADPKPDIKFALVRDAGDAADLTVLNSSPAAGKSLPKKGGAVELTLQAPTGACNSLVCMFPGAAFPTEVITTLVAEGFDVKYAAALSVAEGRVVLDEAHLQEIKNAAPPKKLVKVPDVTSLNISKAISIIGSADLGVETQLDTTGAADGLVRSMNPGPNTEVEKGTSIVLVYRPLPRKDPVPCIRVSCVDFGDIILQEKPIKLSPLMTKQLGTELMNIQIQ